MDLHTHTLASGHGYSALREKLLDTCMKYQAPILLGTDSHICYTVGRFDEALEVIREVGFPKELILNTRLDALPDIVNCL